MRSLLTKLGIGLAMAASLLAATLTWADDIQPSLSRQPVSDMEKPVSAALAATIAAAQKDGFKLVTFDSVPGKPLIEIEFLKTGKTADGFGLLQVKWDQKQTIKLTVARIGDDISLIDATQKIQVKPPIGEWKTLSGSETPLPSWSRPGF